jgi:hypothetical protein
LRPGPCIYIPQEQGGPVIPPGTGYLPTQSFSNESRLGYIALARPNGKQVCYRATDVLLWSRPLKRTGVCRVLHSNEPSTNPQKTLLLLLCVLCNVFTASFPSKGVCTSQYHTSIYDLMTNNFSDF